MTRRLGPYAPLSATYAADDSIIQVGEPAELLYVRALAFCASSNSDGYFSDAQLSRLIGVGMKDAQKRAAKLVESGVWLREDGGYIVRSWLKWNASSEELGKQRARDRDRKAQRNPPPIPAEDPPDSRRNPNGSQAESNGNPDGFRPRAQARQAPAPPNHLTAQHSTERGAAPAATAGKLIAEHIDACRRRPPDNVVGQLAKQVGALLAEGIEPDYVRAGLARFREKDVHPSVLPSLVNGAMNAPTPIVQAPAKRTATEAKFG